MSQLCDVAIEGKMGLDMVFTLMGELSFVMFDDDHDSMLDDWYDFREISLDWASS